MTARLVLVEQLFHEAVDLAPEARAAFLGKACGEDKELYREIESLLACSDITLSVLAEPVQVAAGEMIRGGREGQRIGPYRLIRLLGRGGMGVVFLAERADGQYSQQVAIKLMSAVLSGNPDMLIRFRSERQILARLEHPNIARLLDGGTTDDGQPYLVIEYVDGDPLNKYCSRVQPSLSARLHLFLEICDAVEYAHRYLVIHRDLKPANIFVTANGKPKLLDFGLARLLDPSILGLSGAHTRASERLLTPEYASPEQIRGEAISTATDVFGLGVLLYELLAGRRPFQVENPNPIALARAVCEQEPPAPSSIAKRVPADLDHIVLMALRKEPERRYAMAAQLSADIRAFLNGFPVAARKDPAFYRAGKFIRRHKTSVGAVAALLAALICGTITTAWQAHRAQHRVQELQTLAESVIITTNQDLSNLPQSTDLRAAMLKSTLDNLDKLTKDPDIAPQLLIQIADAYARVGEINGGPSTANLGRKDDALSSLEKALHIAEQVAQHNGSDPEAMRLLIEAHYELGQMQNSVGRTDEAQQHIMTAVRLARPYQAAAPSDEFRRQFLAGTLSGVADLQIASQRAREALASYREALAVLDSAEFQGRVPKTLYIVGTIHNSTGWALRETGPLSAALQELRHAAEIRERLIRDDPTNLQYQRNLLNTDLGIGRVLADREFPSVGDSASASVYVAKARSIAERLAQLDSKNALAKSDLAIVYFSTGEVESYSHFAAAIDWFRKSIAIQEELLRGAPGSANYRSRMAIESQQLADVLARSGRKKEALTYFQAATKDLVDLVRLQPARKELRRQLMTTHCLLCDLQHQSRDRAGALASQKAAMDLVASVSPDQPDLFFDYSLAQCYDVFSRTDDKNSKEWGQKSRELWARLEENGVRKTR